MSQPCLNKCCQTENLWMSLRLRWEVNVRWKWTLDPTDWWVFTIVDNTHPRVAVDVPFVAFNEFARNGILCLRHVLHTATNCDDPVRIERRHLLDAANTTTNPILYMLWQLLTTTTNAWLVLRRLSNRSVSYLRLPRIFSFCTSSLTSLL